MKTEDGSRVHGKSLRRALLLVLGPWTLSAAGLGLETVNRMAAVELRCESLVNPLAIETSLPRLSWQVRASEQGQRQSGYQVLVASDRATLARGEGDLWDSGRVDSDQSLYVMYRGRPLLSGERAYWRVRLWDRARRSFGWSEVAFWQAGLLSPGDWRADWIAATNVVQPVVGPHNGFRTRLVQTNSTNLWVSIELGGLRRVDSVKLWPAHPFDWSPDTPGYLFPVRYRIEGTAGDDFEHPQVLVDRTQEDQPNPGTNVVVWRFDAAEVRQVRLMVTRLVQREKDKPDHAFALAEMEVLGGGTNLALNAPVSSPHSLEAWTWGKVLLTDGQVLPRRPDRGPMQPATRLRREFEIGKQVRRATLHVTALGLYEVRLNGRRVGDHVLAPEWTDYQRRVMYQTYDVTSGLVQGGNAFGVTLAEGWFAGQVGLWIVVPGGRPSRHYGDKPHLRLQLELEYADGSRGQVVSDAGWEASLEGPIRSADLLDGEVQDARREQEGWDRVGFGTLERAAGGWHPVETGPAWPARLVAQVHEPIRVTQRIRPVGLTEPSPGVYVFDMGQNMVGWCRVRVRGHAGDRIALRHAEVLQPDGHLYVENLRGVAQEDRFTLAGGGVEEFEPQFTYHGFRYVEVRGLRRRPSLDALTGCVMHSAMQDTGDFACSDVGLNRLWSAIEWTLRGNLTGVPTDCPQRDERLGWMGDAQVFAQTACFSRAMGPFLGKWLQDVRDAQGDDGRFADFAPHPFGPEERFSGAPGWGDAGVFVPWRAYVNYGDRRLVEQQFEAARHWVDFVRYSNPDLVWRLQRGNDFNDWLNGDTLKLKGWPTKGGGVPEEVFATAFFAESTALVARMATVLGRLEVAKEYDELALQIRGAFNQAFVKENGEVLGDTQAGYALALHFDLLPERLRPAAIARLTSALDRYQGRPSTGIQTTIRMLLELARAGREDLVYALLNRREVPSWRYMLDQGATTIWERWDGFVEGRGFQDAGINSFNHYAFGAVGEWLWRVVVGLNPDQRHPGWKHFIVKPKPGGGLTWARGAFESPYGRIVSQWRIAGGRLHLTVQVPPNTTASIHVPAGNRESIRVRGTPGRPGAGVRHQERRDGAEIFDVESGNHEFSAPISDSRRQTPQTASFLVQAPICAPP